MALGVMGCTGQQPAEPASSATPSSSGAGSAVADEERGHEVWLAHRRASAESARLKLAPTVRVLSANVAALDRAFAFGASDAASPSPLPQAGVAALAKAVETLADSTQLAAVVAVDPQVAGLLAAVAAGDAAVAVALREQS